MMNIPGCRRGHTGEISHSRNDIRQIRWRSTWRAIRAVRSNCN